MFTLPQHNNSEGRWCRFSECSSRSGFCPAGCPAAIVHAYSEEEPSGRFCGADAGPTTLNGPAVSCILCGRAR